jgi:hypothetical protein
VPGSDSEVILSVTVPEIFPVVWPKRHPSKAMIDENFLMSMNILLLKL